MADTPDLTEAETVAHDTKVDDAIAGILGDMDGDEAPADEQEYVEEALEALDPPPEGGEAVEDQPVVFTGGEKATAYKALERDGWTEEAITGLPEDVMVRTGLLRDTNQRKVDGMFARNGGNSAKESNEESREFDDSTQAEFDDSQSAGVDLNSLALPVAEAIADMSDPQEIAQALQTFVESTLKANAANSGGDAMKMVLTDRAQRNLEGRYEGNVDSLMEEAEQLGAAGRHKDKQGLARFDALIEDALRLSGGEVAAQNNNTSRAARKRGSKPPMSGNRAPKKPRSEDELLDARIARIQAGERNASALRSMQ